MTFRRILICFSLLGTLTACGASSLRDLGDARLSFECPNGISVVRQSLGGGTYEYGYHGPVEGEPDVCLMDTPQSRATHTTTQWYFGYVSRSVQTSDEDLVYRQRFGDLMHGRTENAEFIARGNGQQRVQEYRLVGRETLEIDHHPVETVKIRRTIVNSANTNMSYIDLWYDTADHIFVRSRPSLEFAATRRLQLSWDVIKINRPG